MREWLVLFGDGPRLGWWDWWTRPGFRHVLAVGWNAELRVWVCFDPGRHRTNIVLRAWGEEGLELGALLAECPNILRFRPRDERWLSPPMFSCVAAVKALLGIAAPCALSPYGLWLHLRARGAEVVEVPDGRAVRGKTEAPT